MSVAAKKVLADALALPESDRAELASEILASFAGPEDPDWDTSWLQECDDREADAVRTGNKGSAWTEVRARILVDLRER